MKSFCLLLFTALFLFPAEAYSWFGIKTYEECILKNIEGVRTDATALQINHSCRKAYPERSKQKSGPKLFGPKNSDECILKYSKNTESNQALILIRNACRKIYPRK